MAGFSVMNTHSATAVPSGRALAKATLVAICLGGAVLVTTVLPAEFGVDPVGTGQAMGLLDLYASETAAAAPAIILPTEGGPVFTQASPYKSDAREFTIGAYGTLEFKYQLEAGAAMLYEWKASEPVSFDFHTERDGNPEASDTFEKGEASGKRGAYIAPYAGIHGWYWKNNTEREVTVMLTSTGFYPAAKMFRDGGAGVDVALTDEPR
jgi:hypothetical protein